MRKSKIILFAARGEQSLPVPEREKLHKLASVTYISNLKLISDKELIDKCKPYQFIGLTRRTCKSFNSHIINSLPHLRGISIYATGTEWIDTRALQQRGVQLKWLLDYSGQTVAEHAIGMLLNMSRRIHLSDRIARKTLPRTVSLRGWELYGKRIGIVGRGRIGYRVARFCDALGMKVSCYDPKIKSDDEFEIKSFAELIKQSEIIMLTASVDRKKPIIITAEVMERMKDNVTIINPARPELVDKTALLNAIQRKKVAGYAVDDYVFSDEDLKRVEHGRILQTGHTGWYSDEAMERGVTEWIFNLVELVANG